MCCPIRPVLILARNVPAPALSACSASPVSVSRRRKCLFLQLILLFSLLILSRKRRNDRSVPLQALWPDLLCSQEQNPREATVPDTQRHLLLQLSSDGTSASVCTATTGWTTPATVSTYVIHVQSVAASRSTGTTATTTSPPGTTS